MSDEPTSWDFGAFVSNEDPETVYVFGPGKLSAVRVDGAWKPVPGFTIGELTEGFARVSDKAAAAALVKEAEMALSELPERAK